MPARKKRSTRKRTSLIMAASEGDSNMLYATGFFVPDPFIFFEIGGRKTIVMSDLEIDRAKKEASVDSILSLSEFQRRVQRQGKKTVSTGDVLEFVFRERGIRSLVVPANFPVLLADDLRLRRFSVAVKKGPFFDDREKKNPVEVKNIQDSIRVAEMGLEAGIKALKRAKIGKDRYLYLGGRRLTSEAVKSIVNTSMMAQGWVPSHTIISCGNQCCDPHNEGHGPLRAHSSIIFDIFPRSQKTGYFGDLSRTVVRGRAAGRLREAYEAVRQGQELAFQFIRDGAQGSAIHEKILDLFKERGFSTGKINGRMQGFFHGTGHGLGLDIHESPRIGVGGSTLRAGHVVTVEPGLYYIGMGGVRLEDAVLVTSMGNRNLTRYPRILEI